MHRGHTRWLLLKEFSTISMEAGVIINGSGLVKVLDATSLIRLMDTLFSTPTPILKLFAEGVPNRVEKMFKAT